MLIVYRINRGFEGQIVVLDRVTTPAEMDLWIAKEAALGRSDTAYVQVNEAEMDVDLLADLASDHSKYRINAGTLQNAKGDAVDLGYDPSTAAASPMEAIRANSGKLRVDPSPISPIKQEVK